MTLIMLGQPTFGVGKQLIDKKKNFVVPLVEQVTVGKNQPIAFGYGSPQC